MGKITEIVDLKVTQSGDFESVKSLRGEIERARSEAVGLARAFGEFSPEATEAAARVADLRKEFSDFQQRVNALSPDKFQTIARVASGLAGGFAAAQGAMALLGVESEDLQKTMVKLQAVMALSQGIQGLMDLKQGFGAMVGYLKTVVIPAFQTTAGAANMIGKALGIGIIISGVIALIGWIKNLGKEAERTADMMAKIRENAVAGLGELRNTLEAQEFAMKSLKKSADEIFAEQLSTIDAFTQELQEKQRVFSDPEIAKTLDAALAIRANLISKFQTDMAAARDKASEEERKKQQDAYEKALADQLKYQAEVKKNLEDFLNTIKGIETAFDDADIEAAQRKNAEQKKIADDFIKSEEERRKGEQARKDYYAKKDLEREKAVMDAKQFAYDATSDLLGNTAQLFAEGSAAQKAFAIAQVAFDEARSISATIAGATQAAAAGGPAAPFLVAGYIAAGLATVFANFKRVKDILGTTSAQPQVATSTTLSQPIISGTLPGSDQTGAVMQFGKVYVLEGDMTRVQGRVRTNKNVSVV